MIAILQGRCRESRWPAPVTPSSGQSRFPSLTASSSCRLFVWIGNATSAALIWIAFCLCRLCGWSASHHLRYHFFFELSSFLNGTRIYHLCAFGPCPLSCPCLDLDRGPGLCHDPYLCLFPCSSSSSAT